MIHVTYEATEAPTSLAAIDEDRGAVRVTLDQDAPLDAVVRQLNVEVERFMSSSEWFQLWGDDIVSRNAPSSLRVLYRFDPEQQFGVKVKERKGLVTVHIAPDLDVKAFAAAMTEASKLFLAGGQWFQLYAGEIIDMTPETMTQV